MPSSLSRSSSTIRSAVFLPTPGIRTSRCTSPLRIALIRSSRRESGKDGDRQLRADAADRDELLEQNLLVGRGESEEGNRILAHVRVDAEPHLGAGLRQMRVGGHRDGDVVTDALHVDNHLVGMLLEQNAAKVSDHGSNILHGPPPFFCGLGPQ